MIRFDIACVIPLFLNRPAAKTWLGAMLVVSAACLLYFFTAARDIVVGDTPEMIMAAVTLGVPHASGYPLFTLLGHLFGLLPLGSIPFRLNLFSASCHALTVGVVYFTAFRLTRSRLAALVAALFLAVNPLFWTWSLVAEVFPLNDLLAALLILLCVIWHEHPERTRILVAISFGAGLALSNHHTIVLLAPAFAFVLIKHRALLRPRIGLLVMCVAAFLVGLLPYAYIPWASAHHPAYNWGGVSSLNDLVALVTRRAYGTGNLVGETGYMGGSVLARMTALLVSFGAVTGLLTFFGALAAYQRARWYFWFSLLAFACAGPFFVWIANVDLATAPLALFVLQRFFLLSHVVLAPLLALGVLLIANLLSRWKHAPALAIAGCLLAVIFIALTNYHRIDQSRNVIARHFGEDVLATSSPDSILLITGDSTVFPLLYLQNVEGLGPGTTLIVLPFLSFDWYVRQLKERHPELTIPFDHYDGRTRNLKMFVEANSRRTICIAGTTGNDDHSLDGSYWPYQFGLLTIIEPVSKSIPLPEMVQENELLLQSYHPPAYATIRADTFEADILTIYTWPAFRIGSDCQRVGWKDEARKWYERALQLNPQFPQARDALARLDH